MNTNQIMTVLVLLALLWVVVVVYNNIDDIIRKEAVKRTKKVADTVTILKLKLVKKDKEIKVLQAKLKEAEVKIKQLEDK